MFVYREIYTIATPRQPDFEPRVTGLHARLGQESTSRGTLLLKFMGNASRYQAFRFWDSREAAQAWGRHPDMQAYLASRPPANYLAPPQIDYWEDDASYGPGGDAGFVVQEDGLLAGGKLPDFEALNRDLAETCASAPGFVGRRVYRFLGAPGRFLTVALWASQENYQSATWGEGVGSFLESRPSAELLSVPPDQQFFQVLDKRQS